MTKYKNVKRLYFDGKAQIEQMNAQVELLQNAVANQRMSQSRTALDDSEYSTRFIRLNGAITNLAFNIRKDWRSLPPWAEGFVTPDALKTGKQEMTAVGRAVIAKWLVDEVFNKCFHPSLDPQLSHHLKSIERNIRQFSYTMNSQEELDALTSKVVNWRMATLEGLQHMLKSGDSQEARAEFTRMVTTNLTASLLQYLAEPAPAGVDGSASMIVELAIGIAANLPLESRDIAIIYPLPGEPIRTEIMELEKGALPPLTDITPEDEVSEDEKTAKAGKPKAAGEFENDPICGTYGHVQQRLTLSQLHRSRKLPKSASLVQWRWKFGGDKCSSRHPCGHSRATTVELCVGECMMMRFTTIPLWLKREVGECVIFIKRFIGYALPLTMKASF